MAGKLYIVATPIGNLEDITLRALRVLREVDYILCEDKRITIRLLNKYQINSKLISFHKFNENRLLGNIFDYLKSGKDIAIVSDSGTPLICDPGLRLISNLGQNSINVVSVPGPSALTSALSVCPFKHDEFLFLGFLPGGRSKRRKIISTLSKRSDVVMLFVAPHDLVKYLEEVHYFYPDLEVFYAREITKIYEEYWSGKIKELLEIAKNKKIKGEIVLCLNFKPSES